MRFIYALAAFASLSAYAACPELAGTYKCSNQAQTKMVVVSQKVEAGATVYTVGGFGLIADGKARPFPDQNLRNGTIVGSCDQNNNLNVLAKGEVYSSEKKMGDLTLTMKYTKTSNTNVKWNQTQIFKPVSGTGSTATTNLDCNKM